MSASVYNSKKRSWTQEELNFFSDLVATGSVVTTKEVDDSRTPSSNTEQMRRVEVTFLISATLKGKIAADTSVVVNHYQAADSQSAINGGDTNIYRLYLKKNANAERFEPTSGQMDPDVSIRVHERRDSDPDAVPELA